MFKQSLIAPAFVAFLALALVAAAPGAAYAAGADATIHEVYQAAEAGRFDDAQKLMDKVLQDHPNSAKAHYVEAELLGKEGRYGDAQTELNTALRLDPAQSFAKPGRVQELQNVINGSHQPRVAPHSVTPAPVYVARQPVQQSGGGGWLVPLIVIIAIFAIIAMVRSAMRRNVVVANGYGPGAYGGGGYGPGYGPGYGGGGMGSGILGGLATGAAVGAGVVVGEELMEHLTHRDGNTEYVRDDRVRDDNWNDNSQSRNDMGGNDFGVSDSSSWDSGGGGGGGGGDDW